jgi:hypothetical protein
MAAKLYFREGNLQQSWWHLEHAHILRQPFAYALVVIKDKAGNFLANCL